MERKRRFQTRAQYAEEKVKSSKFYKMDKMLNYLIAVVAILIVVTLGWLITRDGEPSDQVEQQQQADKPAKDDQAQGGNDKEQLTKPIDDQDKDDEEQIANSEQDAEQMDTIGYDCDTFRRSKYQRSVHECKLASVSN